MHGRLDLYAGRIALRVGDVWHWAELPPGVLAVGPSVWPNTFDAIGPAGSILDPALRQALADRFHPGVCNPWVTPGAPIPQTLGRTLGRVRFGRVTVLLHEWALTDGLTMDFGDEDDLLNDWGIHQ